jgi:hypothetical protein
MVLEKPATNVSASKTSDSVVWSLEYVAPVRQKASIPDIIVKENKGIFSLWPVQGLFVWSVCLAAASRNANGRSGVDSDVSMAGDRSASHPR